METKNPTIVRKGELDELIEALTSQHRAKRDMIVPASKMRSQWGQLVIDCSDDPIMTQDGVTAQLRVDVSERMLQGLADKTNTPIRHLRNLRDSSSEQIVWAASDNLEETCDYTDWMRLYDDTINVPLTHDARSFMVRTFMREDGTAYGRCMMSSSYGIFDSLDAILAAGDAISEVDPTARVDSCDLTERNMRIRWVSDSITAMAPTLLAGYRTPFQRGTNPNHGHGQAGLRDEDGNLPIVHAGFELTNSETGQGMFVIRPRLVVKVCNNGMVIDRFNQFKKKHLGTRLEEGTIRWSHETQQANVQLIKSTTKDAVRHFMSPEFMQREIADIEAKAGTQIASPQKAIEVCAKQLAYTESEADRILSFFIKGAQNTAGGILNAVTAMCQSIEDPDRAAEIEETGLAAMEIAAALG